MKQYSEKQIKQALAELVAAGLATRKSHKCNIKAGKTAKSVRSNNRVTAPKAVSRPGRYSILDGLAIGDFRNLYGSSKHQVFAALARRARTHESEKYSCSPITGAFQVTRLQ